MPTATPTRRALPRPAQGQPPPARDPATKKAISKPKKKATPTAKAA